MIKNNGYSRIQVSKSLLKDLNKVKCVLTLKNNKKYNYDTALSEIIKDWLNENGVK